MYLTISPLVATLVHRARGACCRAVLEFVDWGRIETDRVCLVYQLSSDNLVAAVLTVIDLSFLTPTKLLELGAEKLRNDVLLHLEVHCLKEGTYDPTLTCDEARQVGEEAPYLVADEVNATVHAGGNLRVVQVYAPDRTQRVLIPVVDPIAMMVAKGVFSDITADIVMTDGVLIRDVPVTVDVRWRNENTVDVEMEFETNYTPRGRETIHQITMRHRDKGIIGIVRHVPYQPGQRLRIISSVSASVQIG